ncbi:MAG TPA: efflux transporter outer membrane subunit [Gammaproteobacteria bacterium]|nr:efflux transporter outer membrane subunit [Gammaproteobacteria bacterium]
MSSVLRPPAAGLVLLLALLSGCTVGPDYVRPTVDSPQRWRVDYQAAAEVSNLRWWEQFQDPVLDDLIDTALKENRDLRIAAARVLEFAARVDIIRSGFFPQVGYNGGATRNRGSREAVGGVPGGKRSYNDYSAVASAAWELDLWGRIRRADEAARAELLAEEENRRSVILTLVSSVAASYVNLRQLDRQLEIARETLQTRAETLRLFEQKRKGGVISDLELAQVRTEYEQAAAAVPPLERQIALTENALSILLGHNPGPIPRGKTIDELLLPPVPARIPSDLLARRPDIRAAEQGLIAANARIGVARAEYFPTISLTGLFGYASDELDNLLKGSANLWSVGGSALGPIFTGGRIRGQVHASEAVQKQALVGYLQTVQNAFREVDDALVNLQKSREQLAAERRRVAALSDYARLARLRYDEGYSSYIEVLDAQRFLFDAELQYVAVQADVYDSLIATYKAMGGGWIIEAQKTADGVDFPPPAPKAGAVPSFPPAAEPAGTDAAAAGYRGQGGDGVLPAGEQAR